ncbi:MAG: serine/threonine-protein kinase [Gimesia sp.]|nr:serine/threonine-protein kinase [Gimesia sp.]
MSEEDQLLEGDLATIIASYMRRIDQGESVDRQQLLADHPHLKADLEAYFADVALIENLAGPTASELLSKADIEDHRKTETHIGQIDAADSEKPDKHQKDHSRILQGQFGRYKIEKILGEGAMGEVYLAHDMELDRRVALKVPKIDDQDFVEDLLERFYREARAAATLRHRGICPVYDIGSLDDISYIAMAYIDGTPLSSLIKQDKIKTMCNIGEVILKLALALESAHQNGVIHRDLKPANVIVDEENEPVIMDFGLARRLNEAEASRLTIEGTIMGSPAYMSPEQVSGDIDSVGRESDIYNLGVILYELLTGGQLPFQGPVVVIIGQILGTEPDLPSELKPGVDPELEAICLKMMAKKTEDRYQSMQEVVDVLTAYLKNKAKQPQTDKQPLTLFEKFNNRPPRTKAITAAACASVLFLAAAITFFFKMGDRTVAVKLDDPTAEVTIDGKHHVEFDGDMVGQVELDIGPHEVSVTRGGVVVKGWEKFNYVVEKHGKRLLEIKLLDEDEPSKNAVTAVKKAKKAVTAVEKDRVTIEKIHPILSEILKQKPVDVQEFDFNRDLEKDGAFFHSVRDGRHFIESKRGNVHAAWPSADHHHSGLVQIDVRTIEGCGWMVVFHNDSLDRGFRIEMKNGSLYLGPSIFGPRPNPLTPDYKTLMEQAPTHGLKQFDRVHVLIEGRTITVFLNGKQCGDQITLDFDLGSYRVCSGARNVSSKSSTKVEYERILQFPLIENLDQTFKTTDKRLIEILKQKPIFEKEYEKNEIFDKNENWLREQRNGRSIIQYKATNSKRIGYWFWYLGQAAPSGLIQIDVRFVEGYGWLQTFHDHDILYGFHVSMRNGELVVGPDLLVSPIPSTPKHTVLTKQVPTNGPGNWDRLHILLEGRKITVFLNGQQCGDPVDLESALNECSIFPGIIAFGNGKRTRIEYERILQYPLIDDTPLKAGK